MWTNWRPWPRKKIEEPENFASIKFTVENGQTNIELDWKCEEENEEDVALELGCLLSDINAGKYSAEIVEMLKDYMETNAKEFIEDVALIWKESNDLRLEQKQTVLDEPLVHPLKVFRQSSVFRE
jgi:hypothetical protein